MNGKHISKCLDSLPAAMLEEAMKPYKSRFPGWRIFRVAACLAIIVGLLVGIPRFFPGNTDIVAGAGILSVKVFAMNAETNEIVSAELEAGIAVENTHYWPLIMNRYPGLPVFLSVETEEFPKDKITYDIRVDHGEYLDWGNTGVRVNSMGKAFSIPNDVRIYWTLRDDVLLWDDGDKLDVVYTTITILCEDHIIGYALLRFDRAYGRDVLNAYPGLADTWIGHEDEPAYAYWSNLIASVSFPKIDGKYQDISQNYVDECINKVKNEL